MPPSTTFAEGGGNSNDFSRRIFVFPGRAACIAARQPPKKLHKIASLHAASNTLATAQRLIGNSGTALVRTFLFP
jgi:hypothetical protein